MSIEKGLHDNCNSDKKHCSEIELLLHGKEKDLGGFCVRRLLPSSYRKSVGPWVFFDHAGPATFPPGEGINVRPHPHINLATVTYLFEGEVLHRDCLGNRQLITPGDINLMVAGRGIVHSERERPEVRQSKHSLHGLQLWLALPISDEETEPNFYHYPADAIPEQTINGVVLRVMMGEYGGMRSPVKTFAETIYLEANLETDQHIDAPNVEERAVYVASGKVDIAGTTIEQYSMAILKTGRNISITAKESSRIAIIGGESVGERYIEWNFVSSRKERIEQAKLDWEKGKFAKIPGDENEYIPLPG